MIQSSEFTVKSSKHTFRVKDMNAIEILALQTNLNNDSTEDSLKSFKTILERIEVKCDNAWVPAKMKDREVYFPDGLEDDIVVINELLSYFIGTYLKSIFQKSNESK